MKALFLAAVAATAALAFPAHAAPKADSPNQLHPWVLLGVDVNNGAVTARDSAKDASTISVYGEGLPVYRTKAECQVALRQAIKRYSGLSHAEGNFGNYLCTDIRAWTTGK